MQKCVFLCIFGVQNAHFDDFGVQNAILRPKIMKITKNGWTISVKLRKIAIFYFFLNFLFFLKSWYQCGKIAFFTVLGTLFGVFTVFCHFSQNLTDRFWDLFFGVISAFWTCSLSGRVKNSVRKVQVRSRKAVRWFWGSKIGSKTKSRKKGF